MTTLQKRKNIKKKESDENTFDAKGMKESKAELIPEKKSDYKLKKFNSAMNHLAHILIGATVGAAILYVFRPGTINATRIHIILCVLGYKLLMAEAILSMSPHNSWSSSLKLVHRRRVHWILQLLGSVLAIAGSLIKMSDKTVHWETLHGKFALVALLFTYASLLNGLASLYAYELRRIIPANLSKITHICLGTVAFTAACISLCYGFDKNSFRNWASPNLAYTVIAFTAASTCIIIITPLINFADKTVRAFKR